MRAADRKRLDGNARWRGSNRRYLETEIDHHLKRGRAPADIAVRMGIRISVVVRTIAGLLSKGKLIDGDRVKR